MSPERRTPRIIPVIDVMGGVVVHAVGGRREQYRPIVSKLTNSAEPLEIAKALIAASGANELYVADLDAIRRGIPSPAVDGLLAHIGVDVLVDRSSLGSKPIPTRVREIYSLEARFPPESYRRHARMPGAVFSIELMNGRLVDGWADWSLPSSAGALELVRKAFNMGYRAFVVLDLTRVGTGRGCGTEDLLRAIHDEFAGIELIAGGGVKIWADVDALGEAGADAVLVASALHDSLLKFPHSASDRG